MTAVEISSYTGNLFHLSTPSEKVLLSANNIVNVN